MELKRSMSQKLRMDGRDYSRPGWYFITLGADHHQHLCGVVERGEVRANARLLGAGVLREQRNRAWDIMKDLPEWN